MKEPERNLYSLAATSEDDISEDTLLTKEGTFDGQRPSFWRRHQNMLLVQVGLLAVYTLALYLAAAKIRSQSLHGPNLIHCIPPVEWHPLRQRGLFLADWNSSCERSGHLGRTRVYSWR